MHFWYNAEGFSLHRPDRWQDEARFYDKKRGASKMVRLETDWQVDSD